MKTHNDIFANPPSRFRFAPFWFWNHDLDHDEIRRQIQRMHEQGVGGFVIHGRFGLVTLYLSDQWLDLCETAIREARRLGMKVYLYDENDFPSGTADGRVTENPQFRQSGLVLSADHAFEGPRHIEIGIEALDGIVAVLAAPLNNGVITLGKDAVDLTDRVEGGRLSWHVPAGRWSVMGLARKVWHEGANRYCLDYMNPKAVARFIELTHERYRQRFGQFFGDVIEGVFLDEPAVNYVEPGIPWTGLLCEAFREDHGYELIPVLPALFKDAGPQAWKPRCDFWSTVSRLYSESYFAQIHRYCQRHGLKSVGHVANEGELFLQARRQVDFFRCGRHMHFGGTDLLSSKTWPDVRLQAASGLSLSDTNNHLAPKLASSVAHQFDKPRVMSEAFGHAGGWAVSLRTLKRLTDWQVALGVNLLMPHAFYYTILGFRRWESPPAQSCQSTFWPYYRKLADYAARLCALFSGGDHVAAVAVLYPIKSLWTTNLSGSAPDERAARVITGLTTVTVALTRAHHDFDLVCEEILQEAEIDDKITIRSPEGKILHQFKVLLIPPSTTLSRNTVRCIERFYRCGGTVVLVGSLPDSSPELGLDSYASEVFKSIFSTQNGRSGLPKVENDNGGKAFWIAQRQADVALERQVQQVLDSSVEPEVRLVANGTSTADIICYKYRKAEADFYLLVNSSEERAYSVQARFDSVGEVMCWNAETGQVSHIERYGIEAGQTIVDLDFQPTQSHVLSICKQQASVASRPSGATRTKQRLVMSLPDRWRFVPEKANVLPLTDWRMTLGAQVGTADMQGVPNPDLCQGTRRYETVFQLETDLRQARLLFDGLVGENCIRPFNLPFSVRVTLNGKPVKDFEPGRYLDHLMREAEVGSFLQPGRNHLVIDAKVEFFDGGSLGHPVLLLGDFAVKPGPGNWVAAPAVKENVKGSWTEFGYPFYSGTAAYVQDIKLSELRPHEAYFLVFENVCDLVQVVINEQSAGVVAWEPYEIEITEYLKRGTNRMELKVTNSLQNLLVLVPKPSGIVGQVKLVARALS